MNSDLQTLTEMLERLQEQHMKVLSHLITITEKAKKRTAYELPDTCDIGFTLREMETLLDEWRKDVTARKNLVGKLIAFEVLSDPDMGDTVQGELARGKIFMKKKLRPPKKGSVEYEKAMEHFGVPPSVTTRGLVKLDWEKTSDALTEEMEDGTKALGFLDTFDLYGTSWTRRK
jgi:hypothetical protein|tara:strand:+ start:186 stop:707 length:522 start_codon:yes stop_codon:yes gene_type:complete